MPSRNVFIAGATGYMGSRLAAALISRGHAVSGLAREGSEARLPAGCKQVTGNALQADTFRQMVKGSDTYVQLVGVAHPSPAKAEQFKKIDLRSCTESLRAAVENKVEHFIYVSVAHPAPTMRAYIEVRTRCEQMIRDSGLNATILRPWYVLGPGHRWPYLLKPMYWIAEVVPITRDGAKRLGLLTLQQMIAALIDGVENPASGVRVMEVPELRLVGKYGKLRSL